MSTPSTRSAKRPVAAPAVTVIGIIVAASITVIGAAGIRETLVTTDLIGGSPWLGRLLGRDTVLTPANWTLAAGAAAMFLGLCTLVATVKPRRATHLSIGDSGGGVWIRGRDAARLAADTARGIDSVTGASATAKGRRKLHITAVTFGDATRVHDDLTAAVDQRLQAITPTPRVRTRVTAQER